jgi:predicted transcriptional regulator of viral defense system
LNSLSLSQAAAQALNRYPYPLITAYDFGVLLYRLCHEQKVQGQSLRRQYSDTLEHLKSYGLLQDAPGFPEATVFIVVGRTPAGAKDLLPQEAVCIVDPFAYVSHLSAMKHHGLTDRLPTSLYISSPAPKDWKRFAEEKVEKDLGKMWSDYAKAGFPGLVRREMTRVYGVTVHMQKSLHLGAYKKVPDSAARVATVGRTFLDMIRDPDLCGGIRHVVDVYREHGQTYLPLILSDTNRHGKPIDKVRVGYLLEEVCGISDPRIGEWHQYAQRGGSRKLYAKGEYRPVFSERWCLSLNVD